MADKYYGITGTAGLLVNYGLNNHLKMCVTDCIFEISDPLVKKRQQYSNIPFTHQCATQFVKHFFAKRCKTFVPP